jgi:hypothetical protein
MKRAFVVGDIVWGKVAGHPWWPATVDIYLILKNR